MNPIAMETEATVNNKADSIDSLRRTVSELERQMDAVRRIAVGLSTATEMDQLVREALDISLDLAEADAGSILLFNPDKNKLVFEYVVGPKAGELMGVEIEPDRGLAGAVFGTGETCVTADVGKEQAHFRELGEKVGYITTNMVTVPLKSSEKAKPLGVMQALNKRGASFNEYDVKLIETIAAHIGVAIETARLHEEARLATVVRFLGDISHDVKNMITPTVTGAETLQMIADDCFRKFDEHLSSLKPSGNDAQGFAETMAGLRDTYPEIIEMILEGCEVVQQRMAEISAAVKGIVSEPHFEPVDLLSIARRVESMLTAQARKKSITVTVTALCELPMVTVDGKQIFNALYNLVFNAIDACSQGDTVAVRFADLPGGEAGDGHYILMECADTGPGIPDHVKAKLFTDEAISTKPMGTGLGTRIVKNVIDAHGGTVELESRLGAGTCIRCRIPANRSGSGSAAKP